jgi:Beta-lactamase superfamily domain
MCVRRLLSEATQAVANPSPPGRELLLQPRDRIAPVTHERELAVDVRERLVQDLAPAHRVLDPAPPFASKGSAGLLGGHQLPELLERQAEEVLESERFLEAVDVLLAICPVGPIDVLFIPVGGGPTIDGREAAAVVDELTPGLVVPMHFATEAVDFIAGPEEFLSSVSGNVQRPDASEIEFDDFAGARDGTAIVALAADLA